MLEVCDLVVGYGDVQVLWGVSLEVRRGEIVTLLGANGAGKTTLLRAISRVVDAQGGSIVLGGIDVTRAPARRVVEGGIAHVPEGRRLWPEMSIEDNLMLGAYTARARSSARATLREVYALFPRVLERRSQIAGTLSGGEQQMVAIGRGLMSKPDLLILDEPSLGLAPIVVDELFSTLRAIRDGGVTIMLVEQNVASALALADRGYVLETGRIAGSGTRDELLSSEDVRRAYLGA